MDFSLTPQQQAIQEQARKFVDEVCLPLESEWPLSDYEADPETMAYLRKKFTEYGFRGVAIPSEAGGKGAGTMAKCLIFEEFKRSWILFGNTVTWSAFLDPHPALWHAPQWQKDKYLQPILDGKTQYHICISEPDHGSDVAGIETTAVRQGDHYVLNGLKRWTPDPFHPFTEAAYLLVYAVTDPGKGYKGISTFLIDWPADGIEVLNVKETAAAGSFLGRVADLKFTNVKIPAENLLGELNTGFKYVQDQLNRNRTVIAAGNVGTAKRALGIAIDYAKKRESFGAPLADRQVIQFRLAEMATEIEMSRALAYKAAWKIDQGLDARVEAAMAKAYCPKIACDVLDRTIQILGGVGVLKESRLPDAYWVSRMSQIAEGSVEMMKMTIAKSLLGGVGLTQESSGPLQGLHVLELAGLGPASFAAMLLADMGASVVRIVRPGHTEMEKGATLRGRMQVALDLRSDAGREALLAMARHADALVEGYRPGVMERLALGPEAVHAINPGLVYARMTGWGQSGPRASTAGHDIDYIAITGALHSVGDKAPAVPLNLVGDYGGGALYAALGMLAGVMHVRAGGAGQVVDCAICDGTVSLLSLMHGLRHVGRWNDQRHSNVLDGAAPYYRTYACADGRHVAVGAIEPPFFALLLDKLRLDPQAFGWQNDRSRWPEQADRLAQVFKSRTRAEWSEIFAGSDACVAPVNTVSESLTDEHLLSRNAFVNLAGEVQPAPAPRFLQTPSTARISRQAANAEEVLALWEARRRPEG